MLLNEPISTPFGYALAPLDLRAAQQATQALFSDTKIRIPRPTYSNEGYQSTSWKRTSFLIPAASPRSSYSKPLCGGEKEDELPEGTYERLAEDAKVANEMPFFGQRQVPLSGTYNVGSEGGSSTSSQSNTTPTLVVERLVPVQASKKSNPRVLLLAHGLGYCKETFLPMVDRFVQDPNHNIDQVWLVDALGHGLTSQCNPAKSKEELLSSQHRVVDSNDYARDMLLLLTCYLPRILPDKDSIPSSEVLSYCSPRLTSHKIVAIGHSFAGTAMLQISIHLPQLFESIAVIEPIILHDSIFDKAVRVPLAQFTLMKRDKWSSRSAARQDFEKDRMTATWDPRVLDCFVAGALVQQPGGTNDAVERCCDRVAEALCIRGNVPGTQLGNGTLNFVSPKVKVLYVSSQKPMLTTLDHVKQLAEQVPTLDFQVIKGSHSLPQEQPDLLADMIARSLLQEKNSSKL
jgi:pimeloyl-ACP methyl ester carboxylesterase